MNRTLIPRLIALLAVIVLGVYYIVFDVLDVHVTSQPFSVTVDMPNAGGLYPGANVTYRGVQVGTVSSLSISPRQVQVQLSIDPGKQIPDNGPVLVKELSALGEQYVDLQPRNGSGPMLAAGTVIPQQRVVLPTPIGTALIDLGAMLKSVNGADVQTDESFLTSAFIGTGPGLRTIIVTGQQLFDALVAARQETVNLIVDGHSDLQTLQATDGDLATFTRGLASLTGQLANSNSDLQALISNGASFTQQAQPFLSSTSAQLESVIANLAADAKVSDQYNPDVRAIFELLPLVSGDLGAVATGGRIRGVLDINTANTVCPYVIGASDPGPTEKITAPALGNSCTTSAPDMLQRGAGSTPVIP